MKYVIAAVVVTLLLVAAGARAADIYQPAAGEAVLYESANCTGGPALIAKAGIVYNDLRLREMSAGKAWEHRITCVHVGPSTRAELYENRDYTGARIVLMRDEGNPEGRWTLAGRWEHEVSSLKIFKVKVD